MNGELRREWSLRDLVLFHTTAVVSVRWVSLAAARGPSSLALWALSFLAFFLPSALVVRDLSRRMPGEGGLYLWTRDRFGPAHGFVCAWSYVVSNLVYFPALLTFVADLVYAFLLGGGPDPEARSRFVLRFTLAAIGGVTAVQVLGVRFGKWVQNVAALSILLTGALLVLLGGARMWTKGSATRLEGLLPDFGSLETWRTWSSICFAMAGLELASTMGGEVRDARTNLPRAVLPAGLLVVSVYVLGTLAALLCAEPKNLGEIRGVLEALAAASATLGVALPLSLLALLLALGGLGNFGAWLGGSSRMPYAVGIDRFLPASFARLHPRFGTPVATLLAQAAISGAIAVAASAGSTVGASYRVLNDAATVLYFVPYLYLFASHLAGSLRSGRSKALPSTVGLLSTAIAVLLAILPPADATDPGLHVGKVLGGSLGLIALATPLVLRARRGG